MIAKDEYVKEVCFSICRDCVYLWTELTMRKCWDMSEALSIFMWVGGLALYHKATQPRQPHAIQPTL